MFSLCEFTILKWSFLSRAAHSLFWLRGFCRPAKEQHLSSRLGPKIKWSPIRGILSTWKVSLSGATSGGPFVLSAVASFLSLQRMRRLEAEGVRLQCGSVAGRVGLMGACSRGKDWGAWNRAANIVHTRRAERQTAAAAGAEHAQVTAQRRKMIGRSI